MESGADAPLRPYLSLSKALDQVRPGGVVAFITSKGTMDKQSPEVRKYIAQRAELLGAIRLPNNAFSQCRHRGHLGHPLPAEAGSAYRHRARLGASGSDC